MGRYQALKGSLNIKLTNRHQVQYYFFVQRGLFWCGTHVVLLVVHRANDEIEKVRKTQEAEIARLQAALKRAQMKTTSLEQSIEQRVSDCARACAVSSDCYIWISSKINGFMTDMIE